MVQEKNCRRSGWHRMNSGSSLTTMPIVCVILAFALQPLLAADEIVPLACSGKLAISDVAISKPEAALYETVEITFRLEGQWQNPFDTDEICVDAVFTGPQGTRVSIPGFYYQDYRRTVVNGRESYQAVGAPCWKVRFAPHQLGNYACKLTAKNGGQEISSEAPAFACTRLSDSHGYLRISPHNPLYFELDDGTPFCAVAMDKALGTVSHFEHVHQRFSAAGGNFNRLLLRHGLSESR